MTTPPQDPQGPQYPEYPQYPQYPTAPQPSAPALDPRRLRAGRVWAGIGIGIGVYVLSGVVLGVLYSFVGSTNAVSLIISSIPLLVLLAMIVVGIVLMVRGDRSLGLGLLLAGAGIPIVAAGVCVAILIAIGASGGSG